MDGEQYFTPAKRKPAQSSPAGGEHELKGIDLNEHLVANRSATFFFRMKGDAMKEAGILDNDILVVDRSIRPVSGQVVVAVLNGDLLVRRFHQNFSSAFLIAENPRFPSINLAEFSDFLVWGVVTYAIHRVV